MTAFLLHTRTGARVLIVDGYALHETEVGKVYTETFDEIVAMVQPGQAHAATEAARRIPLLREGKSIDPPKAPEVLTTDSARTMVTGTKAKK